MGFHNPREAVCQPNQVLLGLLPGLRACMPARRQTVIGFMGGHDDVHGSERRRSARSCRGSDRALSAKAIRSIIKFCRPHMASPSVTDSVGTRRVGRYRARSHISRHTIDVVMGGGYSISVRCPLDCRMASTRPLWQPAKSLASMSRPSSTAINVFWKSRCVGAVNHDRNQLRASR